MASQNQFEEDLKTLEECERSMPYVYLLMFLGIITLLIAITGYLLEFFSPASNFSLTAIGLLLTAAGALWEQHNKDLLRKVQEHKDLQTEKEDLFIRNI